MPRAHAGRSVVQCVQTMFRNNTCRPAMPDTHNLCTASPREVAEALAFALRREARKSMHHADEMIAQPTAGRLVQHLQAPAFGAMKAPPAISARTSSMPLTKR